MDWKALEANYRPVTASMGQQEEPKKKKGLIGSIVESFTKPIAQRWNQTALQIGDIGNTVRMEAAARTNNVEAFNNANRDAEATKKGYGTEGGFLNAGTINTEDEARSGAIAPAFKKQGGNTLQLASNLIPAGKGASLASKIIPMAAAGAAYGGGTALAEGRDEDVLGDTLTGGAVGGATGGVFGLGGKALNKLKGGSKVVGEVTETASKPSLGRAMDAEASGLAPGTPTPGGSYLTTDRSNDLLNFAREGSKKYIPEGIPAGKPRNQAASANKLFTAVNQQLDESLNKINRKLDADEVDGIITNLDFKLTTDPDITGGTALSNKFKELVRSKDIAGLEKLRRQYDKTGFTVSGAGKTSKAAEARAIRDTIDEFVTPLSDDYKAIKGDWQNANELLRLTHKGSYGAAGAEIPIANIKTGKQAIQGAKSKVGNVLAGIFGGVDNAVPTAVGAGVPETAVPSLADKFVQRAKPGVQPVVARGAEVAALTPGQTDPALAAGEIYDNPDFPTGEAPMPPGVGGANGGDDSPYSPANIEANVQRIMQQGGDQKDIAAYLSNVKTIQELTGGTGGKKKDLNASQRKEANNARSALKDIGNIRAELARDSGGTFKAALPGGSFTQRLTGTTGLAASQKNVVDAIARLRSGAAITEDEAKRYMALLPSRFDSAEDANGKLDRLEELLVSFTYPEGGGSGTLDVSQLMQ